MNASADVAVVALSHSPQMAQDLEHRQGLEFRAGFASVARDVARYDPTLVVFFGPDHMRALAGIAPCFTVVESATGYGDWGSAHGDYDVPHDLAVGLGAHLAAAGIDIAMAPELRLDHGFGQSYSDLFGPLAAVPCLPVVINCVDRPLATARRTAELGRAVGTFLRTQVPADERVLVVGSGGISHAPPSLVPGARDLDEKARQALITDNLARAAEAINPDWDRAFLDRLAGERWSELAELTAGDLAPAGTGGAEVRTWIAAAFTGGEPLSTVVYEPVEEWITGMGIAATANVLSGT
ncbi:3-carboxyethylcatechol 2,3-dioxygenase [Actinomycetospora termitidis]|uniref:3-carboxyethylcatechol 2,3-dioxygenase n=1 Tax=Actinomycetospora termitidis TaxID=3053470 RepID=A0ABT7M6Q9_9PSEU|nr:3-carboxyethylcatechol 2,3-dioxygenase [Actinomycetospora sp. Odt1-22]MDL5156228.1 3-carboxyethylcatechol 2,3-dioxygenase [Actinomycetospora sp. Odt1-22]